MSLCHCPPDFPAKLALADPATLPGKHSLSKYTAYDKGVSHQYVWADSLTECRRHPIRRTILTGI